MAARGSLVVVVACVTLLVGAAESSARTTRGYDFGTVRVVRPIPYQPFFGALHVTLAVKRGTHIVTAEISGRSFKRYLRRTSTSRMVASVPRKLIGNGPRVLRITATSAGGHRDHDLLPLLAARHNKHVLTVRAHRVGKGASAVDVTAITHPLRAALRLWVNGHRVDRRMPPVGRGVRRARITAADGLRLGRNTIVATAHDGRRFADREIHVLIEPRRSPLPGVVYTRRARSHGIMEFDASKTQRLRRGDRVTYSWAVVSAPKGSARRLTARTGRRVRLLPDKPGHYRVRLTVREQVGATTRTATTTLLTAATVPIPAFGLPISTTIGVNSQQIAYNGTTWISGNCGGCIDAVAIDRSTGAVTTSGQVSALNGTPDVATLTTDIVDQAGPLNPAYSSENELVVLTAQPSGPGELSKSSSAISALANALQILGVGEGESQQDAQAIANGQPFTIIGSPQYSPGTAYANFDSGADSAGGLSGYIRDVGRLLGNTPAMEFQPGQLLTFHAGPDGAQFETPGGGTLTIGAPPAGGFSISVMDAHSLRLIGTVTSGTGPTATVGTTSDATTPLGFLNKYVSDPSKLVLLLWNGYTVNYHDRANLYRLLGDPGNSQDPTPSPGLTSIGANRDLLVRSFQPADPTDTTYQANVFFNKPYTFLGGAGVDSVDGSPLKLVDAQHGGSAACPNPVNGMSNVDTGYQCLPVSGPNIQGFLAQDDHGRLEPRSAVSLTNAGPAMELAQLADHPPAADYGYPSSPAGTNAQYTAAEGRLFDLADAVNFCSDLTDCAIVDDSMRANYGTTEFIDKVSQVATALQCPSLGQTGTMPAGFYDGSPDYTADQLAALWARVCIEVRRIESVHDNTFSPLECAIGFGGTDCPNASSLLQATIDTIIEKNEINGFIDQTAEVPGLNVVELMSKIAEFVGVVADLAGQEEIGTPIDFVASGLGIGSEFADQPKSSDTDGELDEAEGAMANWVAANGAATATALSEAEGIIYAYPVKLETAFDNGAQGGTWNLSGETTLLTNTLTAGDASYTYPHLLAAANPKSCSSVWSGTVQFFQPGWKAASPSSDPLTYFAETAPMEAVDQNAQGIPYTFGAYIQALKVSSSDATTLAQALFQAPTIGQLEGTDPAVTYGNLPLGSLSRSELSMQLQDPSNNTTTCQPQYTWVTNSP